MGNGWICLHRSLLEHWLWDIKPFSTAQAWIDLLLLANHKSSKKEYSGGKLIEFSKGTINRSIADLSERWGWDRKKTRKFLYLLQSDNMVTIKSTTHGTTVTIVNYSEYQDKGTTDNPTTTLTAPQQLPQPFPINNNDNNNNNENNKKSGRFAPPSLEEIRNYCMEKNYHVDAEAFRSFYESNGWKVGKNPMKNWKAAVLTWEKRDRKETKPKAQDFPQRTYTDDEYHEMEMRKLRKG